MLKFAYAMTFGKSGEHRRYRSEGSHLRRNGEIFWDTFQGKLAKFFVYSGLTSMSKLPKTQYLEMGTW